MMDQLEKILVLVTAQKSSLRLIEYGFRIAQGCGGELHILHVQKGDSVFEGSDSLRLLQNLVDYGGKKGGEIHLYCEKDIAKCVADACEKWGVTQIVLGQPPKNQSKKRAAAGEYERILDALPEEIKIISIPREETLSETTAIA